MKFSFDTENARNINLDIEDAECKDISLAIQNFSYGISSFFAEFMTRLKCDTEEKAEKVQEICMSCVERNLKSMVKDVILECNDDYICALASIQEEMENRGFSEDEISIITKFIEANGKTENSVEVAITDAQTILSKLNEEQGVEKIRKGIEVIRKIVQ